MINFKMAIAKGNGPSLQKYVLPLPLFSDISDMKFDWPFWYNVFGVEI